ncbi:protein kinase [Bacteroidota bacterium]
MIGETISHYKIIGELGGGGMGVVYKAKDLNLDRIVALKFLPPSFSSDKQAKKRFIQEAKAASVLQHRNICTIHDIDQTEKGKIFFCMDYYEGKTLSEKINENKLQIKEIIDITKQISEGLRAAHEAGIIHRDIKPGNIFITNKDEVKILDFGLAKMLSHTQLTQTGITSGTVTYMSPEQAKGEKVDYKTDLWSLGIVLFEMITGEVPFKGEYEQAVLYSIINNNADYDKIKKKSIPLYLEQLIRNLLIKNPEERISSTEKVITILNSGSQIRIDTNILRTIRKLSSIRNLSIGLIFILASVFILYNFLRFPLSLEPTEYVFVTEFVNNTDDKVFDHSLTEAFQVNLHQSPYINLFPKYKTSKALSLLRLPVDKKIDEQTALTISKREGIRFIISGNINKIGDNYVLSSFIMDAATEEKISLQREEASKIEDVLESMDNLTNKIREDLGESFKSISESSIPLAEVTTGSIEALNLYSRGSQFEALGRYEDAIKLKEQALKIDSQFVKAVSDLSYNYYKAGNHEKAMYYHYKILPLVDRVSQREKFSILTIYYGPTFEREYQKAYDYATRWSFIYPNDAIAHATLGHLAMFSGNYQSALEANQRALEIDSSLAGTCFNNSGFAYSLIGEPDSALVFFQKSKKLRPKFFTIDKYIARVLWMKGDLSSAEQKLTSILPHISGKEKTTIYSLLSALYYYRGQLEKTLEIIDKGIDLCKKENRFGDEAYFHYLKAEIEFAKNNEETYFKEIQLSTKLSELPYIEYGLAGISFAKNGADQKALDILNKLSNIKIQDPHFQKLRNSFQNFIFGCLASNSGNLDESIQYFKQVKKLYSGDPLNLMAKKSIADIYKVIDNTLAIEYYKQLLTTKGEIFMAFIPSIRNGGLWVGKLWPEVYLELAQAYSEIDTVLAKKSLEKALNCWENGSNDFKKIMEARKLYSAISGFK